MSLINAVRTFTPKDILGFLGRKWDRRFDGEVQTRITKTTAARHADQASHEAELAEDVRQVRPHPPDGDGDQQPEGVRVDRTQTHRDGTSSVGYYPMTKGVASLVDYQEQALACNRRYLDALAVVDDPAPAYQDLRQLTEPKVVDGRSYAGFNPARRDDVRLFKAVLDGDHITRGFRNADIRQPLSEGS